MCTILHYKMLIQVISVVSGKMLSYTHDPTHITPLLTPPTSSPPTSSPPTSPHFWPLPRHPHPHHPTSDPSYVIYFWPLPCHPHPHHPTSDPSHITPTHIISMVPLSIPQNWRRKSLCYQKQRNFCHCFDRMFSCRWKEKLVMQTLGGQWEHKLETCYADTKGPVRAQTRNLLCRH